MRRQSSIFFLKVFIHKLIYIMPSLNIQGKKKDIYLCMLFQFRCIQGYKCSCKNPHSCYNKRWHHSYRCCLNTRWCLYGDKSMSCTFWEREDIILLFIELISRQLIYRPLGGCFFFFLRAVKRTFNDLYYLCHYSPSLINSKHWKVPKFEKQGMRTLFKSESMQKSTKIANSWQGSTNQNRSSFA